MKREKHFDALSSMINNDTPMDGHFKKFQRGNLENFSDQSINMPYGSTHLCDLSCGNAWRCVCHIPAVQLEGLADQQCLKLMMVRLMCERRWVREFMLMQLHLMAKYCTSSFRQQQCCRLWLIIPFHFKWKGLPRSEFRNSGGWSIVGITAIESHKNRNRLKNHNARQNEENWWNERIAERGKYHWLLQVRD